MPAATDSATPDLDRSGADWPDVRLHVVTGKGGTGKSTVAAALALALASTGKSVLLCEVEGRQGIARMFDVDPLPYEERRIAKGLPEQAVGQSPDQEPPGGASGPPSGRAGSVYALHVDAESALLDYLAMYYRLGRAGRALDRFGVIEFATTIAPGVRDVLLTGKVFEAAKPQRRGKDARPYDAIVLDAPPTGRITQFLNVSGELAGIAKVGPIKAQSDTMMTLFRSPQTAVHLVTVLEEMPVQETADGIAELRGADLPVGGVVVNLVRPETLAADEREALADGEVSPADLRAALAEGGVDPAATDLDDLAATLVHEGREHAQRRDLEDAQRALVEDFGVPVYELPRLASGVDLGALYWLAAQLRKQGMA